MDVTEGVKPSRSLEEAAMAQSSGWSWKKYERPGLMQEPRKFKFFIHFSFIFAHFPF